MIYMDKIVSSFLERNLGEFKDCFSVLITGGDCDNFAVSACDGIVNVTANNYISAFHGIYEYLKKYCHIQLSWCGNREIKIKELKMFQGEFKKKIPQRYRVYMNYCTLDYSMCWWDFDRWEKEIDFMAMNGINMPLAVVGSEAVWFETLKEFGFSDREALDSVSGPSFWAWQLMTNICGYLPPADKSYVYRRLELGKKILNRYLELGMYPIQQGFSGHVPVLMKKKFPKAKILLQRGWCRYPKTAQLDPLDPLFLKFGNVYLNKMNELFGNHHFIACDPFHEGTPPKRSKKYLQAVGKTINSLYENFDSKSVWVMQAWTMRENIVRAVPKDRLLILDLNSEKTPANKNMWGYPVISGMLHNFGGKNALQGKLRHHSKNRYLQLKNNGANVIGTGMFMEGIEQNPVVYDLQFELLTADKEIDFDSWLDDYIVRRYGKSCDSLKKAWALLLETCYKDDGYEENAVGSTLASRPQIMPIITGPCCYSKVYYDTKKFENAAALFFEAADEFKNSDGYQYDLCDIVRQALSNRFYTNQLAFKNAYRAKNLQLIKDLAEKQLNLLSDIDELLSHRSEMCLSRWICDSHKLAWDENEKRYFDYNARTLITLWGDVNGDSSQLYDYSWREWNGLIKEYYLPRWRMFYDYVISHLQSKKRMKLKNFGNSYERRKYLSYELGKKMGDFELEWGKAYCEYPSPSDSDVIPSSEKYLKKWDIL